MDATPCRFLALPAELRLMVYEYLGPPINKHTDIKLPGGCESEVYSSITVVTIAPNSGILLTCKTIRNEASQVNLQGTEDRILTSAPKVFCTDDSAIITLFQLLRGISSVDLFRAHYGTEDFPHCYISELRRSIYWLAEIEDMNDPATIAEFYRFLAQAAAQLHQELHCTSLSRPGIEVLLTPGKHVDTCCESVYPRFGVNRDRRIAFMENEYDNHLLGSGIDIVFQDVFNNYGIRDHFTGMNIEMEEYLLGRGSVDARCLLEYCGAYILYEYKAHLAPKSSNAGYGCILPMAGEDLINEKVWVEDWIETNIDGRRQQKSYYAMF